METLKKITAIIIVIIVLFVIVLILCSCIKAIKKNRKELREIKERDKQKRAKEKEYQSKLRKESAKEIFLAFWPIIVPVALLAVIVGILSILQLCGVKTNYSSSNWSSNHCDTVFDRNGEEHAVDCDYDYRY